MGNIRLAQHTESKSRRTASSGDFQGLRSQDFTRRTAQKLTASSEGSVATGRSSRTTTRCGSKLAAHCGPPPLRLPPEVEGRIGVEGRAKPMLLPPKLELRPRRAEEGLMGDYRITREGKPLL